MKGIENLIRIVEGKEIEIQESIEDVDSEISELEQRKRYLEGRLYEVQSILAVINKTQGN